MGHEGHHHHHEHHHHPEPSPSVTAHHAQAPLSVSVAVVTVSDSRTVQTDEGGASVVHALEEAGHSLASRMFVRDDLAQIRAAVEEGLATGARAIVLTGGTGLAKRDVTVEALRPLFEKEIDGFGELFRALSFAQIGPATLASRATAGVYRGTVLFLLPGSPAAVRLAMKALVLPELGHLVLEVMK